MLRRSTVIFAASLALLSTFESAICFAAAVPAQNRDELERPRFLKREIKRFHPRGANGTTTMPPPGPEPVPVGESSTSDLESLSETLTTPQQAPDTTTTSSPDTPFDHTRTDDMTSPSSSPLETSGGDTSTQQTSPPTETSASSTPPIPSTTHAENGGIQDYINPDTQTSSIIPGTNTDTASDSQSNSAATQSSAPISSPDSNPALLPTTVVPTDISGPGSTDSTVGPQSPSSTQQGNTQLSSLIPSVTVPSIAQSLEDGQTSTKGPASEQTPITQPPGEGKSSVTSDSSSPDTASLTETNGGILPIPTATVPTLGNGNQSPVVGATSTAASLPDNSNPDISATNTGETNPTTPSSSAGKANPIISTSNADEVNPTTANTYTAPPGAIPIVGASLSIPTVPALPGVSQPSEPAATATDTGAPKGTSATETGIPATSKAGAQFGDSSSNPDTPVPTGTDLYTALTNALGPQVASSSTMLANGIVVPLADTLASNVPGDLNTAVSDLTGGVNTLASNVGGAVTTAVSDVTGGVNTLESNIGGAVTTAISNVGGVVNTLESNIGGAATTAVSNVGGAVNTLESNVGGAVTTAVSDVGGVVNTLESNIGGAVTTAVSNVGGAVDTALSGANPSQTVATPVTVATDTNGNIIPNTAAASSTAVAPIVPIVPFVTDSLGSIVSGLPASITNSLGQVVPNPALTSIVGDTLLPAPTSIIGDTLLPPPTSIIGDTLLPPPTSIIGDTLLPPPTSIIGDTLLPPPTSVIGDSLLPPPTSILGDTLLPPPATSPAISLVPNPLASTNSALPPLVPATTDSLGSIIPNPSAATNTVVAGIVPLTEATPGTTLPPGIVVPQKTDSVANTGIVTNSNGDVVPATQVSAAGPVTAAPVVGSSTLSNGDIVPITAAPASTTLPNGSVVPGSNAANPASTTLPNGSVVPIASVPASQTGAPETQAPGATNALSTPPPQTVAPAAQTFPSDSQGPFTQQATGSDSATAQSVPSQIIVQPPLSSDSGGASSSNGPTGLPTGVPLVLYPPSGPVKQPDNTDMIQIGFKYPLNYKFVWTHDQSQQQIFKYLPLGISYGLNIEVSNVTMQTLRAWDTTQDLHYITTLAIAWIPSGLVETLGLLVQTQTSRFYNNPDSSTNTLLSMINNALPIAADNSTDGMDTPYGAMPTSTSSVKTNGAPIGGSIGASAPVKPSAIGIGVGITCGAAVYGAAMFFVARRYKKRRQSHLRSPSMYSSPVMSHIGPDAGAGTALMSGGIDRSISPYHDEDGRAGSRGSGRSGSTGRQQISAPVMAENSLGWN